MKYLYGSFTIICILLVSIVCQGQEEMDTYVKMNQLDSNGLKYGIWKEVYSDGNGWSIGFYIDGKLNGNFMSFDEKGNLQTYCTFVVGKRHGISRAYRNGSLRISEYDSGMIVRTKTFSNDKLVISKLTSRLGRNLNQNESDAFRRARSGIAYEMMMDYISDEEKSKKEIEDYVESATIEKNYPQQRI